MPNDGLQSDPYALAEVAASAILERFKIMQLEIAFVLGSGWSAATDDLGQPIGSCELAELPGFAKPTVIGHGGALRLAMPEARFGRVLHPAGVCSRRASRSCITRAMSMGLVQ